LTNKHNWYVLTGGPGSGKTTLIKELKKRGHNTIKESARYYIEKQLAKGLSLKEIRKDERSFQEAVFRQKQIIHDALATDAITFFDRGYHDTLAYLKYYDHKIASFISETCKGITYKKVFLLDMLPYVKDSARIENQATALKLHQALAYAYQESGHDIIKVPVMPIQARTDFILNEVQKVQEL
jgi:predicted ATPase